MSPVACLIQQPIPKLAQYETKLCFPAEAAGTELSFEELSLVLGAQIQQQPPSAGQLGNQAGETGKAWVDFFYPVVHPIVETAKLAHDAVGFVSDYARYFAEHTNSHPITDQQAKEIEAKRNADAQHKQDAQEADRNHQLQTDHPTTPQQVQDWLDVTNGPPAPPETPYIPTNLTDAPPSHTPQIIIEPVDSVNNTSHHPG